MDVFDMFFSDVDEDVEEKSLEPQLMNVEDLGEVLVGGNPFEVGEQLNDCQGDNELGFRCCCGLTTVSNILKMAGVEVDENEVVKYAAENGLCRFTPWTNPADCGGTTRLDRSELLSRFGLENSIFRDMNGNASLEAVAGYVEEGRGVDMDLNSGYAWGVPEFIGDGSMNHSVTVTGTARDPETGELLGLYVCDSGQLNIDSRAFFLSVDTLFDCYLDAYGAGVVVTDNPIR